MSDSRLNWNLQTLHSKGRLASVSPDGRTASGLCVRVAGDKLHEVRTKRSHSRFQPRHHSALWCQLPDPNAGGIRRRVRWPSPEQTPSTRTTPSSRRRHTTRSALTLIRDVHQRIVQCHCDRYRACNLRDFNSLAALPLAIAGIGQSETRLALTACPVPAIARISLNHLPSKVSSRRKSCRVRVDPGRRGNVGYGA